MNNTESKYLSPGIRAADHHILRRIPNSIVIFVTFICVIPFLLMQLGLDFSAVDNKSSLLISTIDSSSKLSPGPIIHVVLEWSAFCVALFTVILALIQFSLSKDLTTPIIGCALFLAGCLDAFHILAASQLIESAVENKALVPFTWAIGRMFNAIVLIAGILLLLYKKHISELANTQFIIVSCSVLGIFAYFIVHLSATSSTLPQTQFTEGLFSRPFDLIPLLLFLYTGLYLFPKYYKQHPSLFVHTLIIATIPQIVLSLHMAFGSTELYDAHFNIAHSLKILVYAIPCYGLILDYIQTYQQKQQEIKQRVEMQAILQSEIQDRIEMEKQLIKTQAAAEKSSNAKSEFLAMMSHEIRTPMNGVLGMSQLLMKTTLNEQQYTFVNTINDSGNALLDVLNDILDFSKLDASQLEIDPTLFNLEKCAFDVCQLLTPVAQKKGVQLLFRYAPTCMKSFEGDSGRIRQIICNLVSNAIKFTQRGHVLLDITDLEKTSTHAKIKVSVIDTGIGIAEQVRDKLFVPFQQADISTTRKFGGTGLGLAICKQLVDLMQGEITVTSQVNVGSTFSFILELPHFDEQAEGQLFSLKNYRCLIVDDLEINRAIISEVLTHEGLSIDIAEDAETALKYLLQQSHQGQGYDLAIFDHNLPTMDGLTLAKLVLNEPDITPLKIIILSSTDPEMIREQINYPGIQAFLYRPLQHQILMNCIVKVLSNSQLHDLTTDNKTVRSEHLFSGRILLVEDTKTNQVVAKSLLEHLGLIVDIAEDGIAAIDQVSRQEYDLIFMDCLMPNMDGYQTTTEIRHREEMSNTHIPIIAMTASALDETKRKCLQVGMDDFISKPFTQDKLEQVLAHWLNYDTSVVRTCPTVHQNEQSNTAIIDLQIVETLQIAMGDKFGEIVTIFIEDTDELLMTLQSAPEAIAHQDIVRYFHSIKSTSQTFGAKQMADYAKHLEQKYHTEYDGSTIVEEVKRLADYFQTVKAELAIYTTE